MSDETTAIQQAILELDNEMQPLHDRRAKLLRQFKAALRRDAEAHGVPITCEAPHERVPIKVAMAKIEHMVSRGLLQYGVSVRCPWPI